MNPALRAVRVLPADAVISTMLEVTPSGRRPSEAASTAAVARKLRTQIYDGIYPVGSKVPSRKELATANGLSPESAGMVLRMLACEGLVSMQKGNGTWILPRHLYDTKVHVARAGAIRTAAEQRRLASAIRKSVQAEPAVIGRDVSADADGAVCAFSVEAADVGRAVMIALAVVRAAQDSGWSWDGWDLTGVAITAAVESGG